HRRRQSADVAGRALGVRRVRFRVLGSADGRGGARVAAGFARLHLPAQVHGERADRRRGQGLGAGVVGNGSMTAFVLGSLTALFVTVNPIKGAAVFAVLSKHFSRLEQRRVALRSTLIASGLLLVFALFGDDLLRGIGITLAGVRVGGAILLLLLSIDIVFA